MSRILTVNAGSSSLKLRLLDAADALISEAELPALHREDDRGRLGTALGRLGPADAVVHRIVHGGERFTGPVRIDPEVLRELRKLTPLAPLHQPAALDAIDAVTAERPDVPAVACFDTAFHATLPPAAATYAVPAEWRKRHGLRRFGFHGLSHTYAARRTAEMVGREPGELRVVTCHLGAGASLAAIEGGRSVDTTMGFTPVEGLVMASRSGNVDPGMLLWLLRYGGHGIDEVSEALEHTSGLYGLAGTADMREVLRRAAEGEGDAALARDVYVHRLRALIAAMAAAMDGLDALVFTGGVGEGAAEIRAAACAGLGFLGVRLDADTNAGQGAPDREIGAPDAPVRTLVVWAREDLEMAREARAVLSR